MNHGFESQPEELHLILGFAEKGQRLCVRRTSSAILAAGLLIAGEIIRPGDEVLGTVLLVAAALPALHVLAPWRLR